MIDLKEIATSMGNRLGLFLLVFSLMPLNWGLELLKWRFLTKEFQKLSIVQEIKSILAGIVVGLLTPNRIGELGGRLMYIEAKNRSRSLYVNSVCSTSQLLATLLFGLVAVCVFADSWQPYLLISRPQIILASWIIILVLIGLYFRSNSLKIIFNYFEKKVLKDQNLEALTLSSIERLKLLLLSILRYGVFNIQFAILLMIFIPDIPFLIAITAVALIYFGSTVVPTSWLSSLAIKTSFAFFIVDLVGYEGIYGIMASILLWVINLIIPALLGFLLIGGSNIYSLNKA